MLKWYLVFLVQEGYEVPYRENGFVWMLSSGMSYTSLSMNSVLMNQQYVENNINIVIAYWKCFN